jgi:hypothetical protein
MELLAIRGTTLSPMLTPRRNAKSANPNSVICNKRKPLVLHLIIAFSFPYWTLSPNNLIENYLEFYPETAIYLCWIYFIYSRYMFPIHRKSDNSNGADRRFTLAVIVIVASFLLIALMLIMQSFSEGTFSKKLYFATNNSCCHHPGTSEFI